MVPRHPYYKPMDRHDHIHIHNKKLSTKRNKHPMVPRHQSYKPMDRLMILHTKHNYLYTKIIHQLVYKHLKKLCIISIQMLPI